MSKPRKPEAVPSRDVTDIAGDLGSRGERVQASKFNLILDGHGKPLPNEHNLIALLDSGQDGWEEWRPAFDAFKVRTYMPDGSELSDSILTECLSYIQKRIMPKANLKALNNAMHAVAMRHAFDAPKDWALGLKWDGTERIARWLTDIFGGDATDYAVNLSANWWRSYAARTTRPGCKVDTMIVWESDKQGIGKSSVCAACAPNVWAGVVNRSPDDPKFIVEIQGKLILEVAELSAFSRADRRKIKSMLSVQSDHVLLPYGHHAQELPRRCVFVGTTNNDDYLEDETGNRRFLPFKCGSTGTVAEMVERTIQTRDQCMAEAVAAIGRGENWHVFDDSSEKEQEDRMFSDSWMSVLAKWSGPVGGKCTSAEVLLEALGIASGKQTRADQMRLGACAKRLGWVKVKIRIGESTIWGWKLM